MFRRRAVTVGIPTYNRSRWLGEAIRSVLSQDYPDISILISDNASTDDTEQVVSSFFDPRIVYYRHAENVGSVGNFNFIIGRTTTEFLVLLGDDDLLLPGHLRETLRALERFPSAGLAHAGSVIVDEDGATLDCHVRLVRTAADVHLEPRRQALERMMRSGWGAAFSSVTFRTEEIVKSGGLSAIDSPIDDLGLLLRLAAERDFVYVNRPLVCIRVHRGATSSALGMFGLDGFRSSSNLGPMVYALKMRFLSDVSLSEADRTRMQRLANAAYRHDRLSHLSPTPHDGGGAVVRFLLAMARAMCRNRRLVIDPVSWRFIAGQLGARRVRVVFEHALRREQRSARPKPSPERSTSDADQT